MTTQLERRLSVLIEDWHLAAARIHDGLEKAAVLDCADQLAAILDALPSEGNRERSERTADGVCEHCHGTRKLRIKSGSIYGGADIVKCPHCYRPASASMSAGVSEAMEKAAIEAFYGSSGLPTFAQRIVLALDAAERARTAPAASDWHTCEESSECATCDREAITFHADALGNLERNINNLFIFVLAGSDAWRSLRHTVRAYFAEYEAAAVPCPECGGSGWHTETDASGVPCGNSPCGCNPNGDSDRERARANTRAGVADSTAGVDVSGATKCAADEAIHSGHQSAGDAKGAGNGR